MKTRYPITIFRSFIIAILFFAFSGVESYGQPRQRPRPWPTESSRRPAPPPKGAVYQDRHHDRHHDAVDLRSDFDRYSGPRHGRREKHDCSTAFSLCELAAFEYTRTTGRRKTFSGEFAFWAANAMSERPKQEGRLDLALAGLKKYGICSEELMPHEQHHGHKHEHAYKPSYEAMRDAEKRTLWQERWIKRWNHDTGFSDKELGELKQSLRRKHPVVIGLRWPKSNDPTTLMTRPPASQLRGDRHVLLVGFRDTGPHEEDGYFIFFDGHALSHDDTGYGKVSYDYLMRFGSDALALRWDGREPYRMEGEKLALKRQQGCRVKLQDMASFGHGLWSDDAQVFVNADRDAVAEWSFNVQRHNEYRIVVHSTCAPDYGIVQVDIDGIKVQSRFDLYSGRVSPTSFVLGDFVLPPGPHRIKMTVRGKSPFSSGYHFAIDAIDFFRKEPL